MDYTLNMKKFQNVSFYYYLRKGKKKRGKKKRYACECVCGCEVSLVPLHFH